MKAALVLSATVTLIVSGIAFSVKHNNEMLFIENIQLKEKIGELEYQRDEITKRRQQLGTNYAIVQMKTGQFMVEQWLPTEEIWMPVNSYHTLEAAEDVRKQLLNGELTTKEVFWWP